ncbi:unnamed protein product [Diabrotica balteata]|uniref:Uncharacterized protein n=1 Tax=Diabrotica balteata TaxID=107213 RepID=A0A9N9XCM9_DIABA|nr:unnamed protein product [Diabrotica balteata]
MFKYAICLFAVVYLVNSKVSVTRFTQEGVVEKINDCAKKLGTTNLSLENLVKAIEQNQEVEVMKKLNLCSLKAVGTLNDDNQVDYVQGSKNMRLFFPENAEEIITKCFKKLEDPIEDAYKMSVCMLSLAKEH